LGIFGKVKKCVNCEMNHFSLFCKPCLVLFSTLIIALRFYAAPVAPHI